MVGKCRHTHTSVLMALLDHGSCLHRQVCVSITVFLSQQSHDILCPHIIVWSGLPACLVSGAWIEVVYTALDIHLCVAHKVSHTPLYSKRFYAPVQGSMVLYIQSSMAFIFCTRYKVYCKVVLCVCVCVCVCVHKLKLPKGFGRLCVFVN